MTQATGNSEAGQQSRLISKGSRYDLVLGGRGGGINFGGLVMRFLLDERLLDELQLLVHPVIVGSGARLFEGYGERLPLTLAHCHAHGNGVVALRYTLTA